MTNLVKGAKCPECGEELLVTFRTVGLSTKTFEYHHDRIPSLPCIRMIEQPDAENYEEMVYKPLIERSPEDRVH